MISLSKKMLFVLCLGLVLAGCGPRKPLTPEQEALFQAKEQCSSEATSMNDAPYSSINPLWDAYFTMCMSKFGYGEKQLRTLWY